MPQAKSPGEAAQFLCRVFNDLSAADDFVGITKEELIQMKAREAFASVLRWWAEKTNESNDPEGDLLALADELEKAF